MNRAFWSFWLIDDIIPKDFSELFEQVITSFPTAQGRPRWLADAPFFRLLVDADEANEDVATVRAPLALLPPPPHSVPRCFLWPSHFSSMAIALDDGFLALWWQHKAQQPQHVPLPSIPYKLRQYEIMFSPAICATCFPVVACSPDSMDQDGVTGKSCTVVLNMGGGVGWSRVGASPVLFHFLSHVLVHSNKTKWRRLLSESPSRIKRQHQERSCVLMGNDALMRIITSVVFWSQACPHTAPWAFSDITHPHLHISDATYTPTHT